MKVLSEVGYVESVLFGKKVDRQYKTLDAIVKNKNNPKIFSYFGINFKNGKIYSVKTYFHVFEDLKEDALLFIPKLDDYLKCQKYYKSLSFKAMFNVGIAFTMKFYQKDNSIGRGFYFMSDQVETLVNDMKNPISIPQELIKECKAIGINYEYKKGKKLFKKYYYYNSESYKEHIEENFGITMDSQNYLFEYSESRNAKKVNIYSLDSELNNEHYKHFSKDENEIIKHIKQKYNLKIFEFGTYLNQNIKSVYFFEDNSEGFSDLFRTILKWRNEN